MLHAPCGAGWCTSATVHIHSCSVCCVVYLCVEGGIFYSYFIWRRLLFQAPSGQVYTLTYTHCTHTHTHTHTHNVTQSVRQSVISLGSVLVVGVVTLFHFPGGEPLPSHCNLLCNLYSWLPGHQHSPDLLIAAMKLTRNDPAYMKVCDQSKGTFSQNRCHVRKGAPKNGDPGSPFSYEYGDLGSPFSHEIRDPLCIQGLPLYCIK